MKPLSSLMDFTIAYRLWQMPFAERKLEPLLRRNDISAARSVLDVGCGPGTNAGHFGGTDYCGIDASVAYIASARRRFRRTFVAADARTFAPPAGTKFDFILVNSLLHHVDDDGTHEILANLGKLLTSEGSVHVLDLVLPERPSLARTLARFDRGDHPRPLSDWKAIFTAHFQPLVFEPYPLKAFGVTLWNMVYFKGSPRT